MSDKTHLFTPYESPTSDIRVTMSLNETDWKKIGRGKPWQAKITDQWDGRHYLVRGADCGAGANCFCAAEIVQIITR